MTFTEFLAGRVAELERERAVLRKRVSKLERSRDQWKARARVAAKPTWKRGVTILAGPKQVPNGTAAYNWNRGRS